MMSARRWWSSGILPSMSPRQPSDVRLEREVEREHAVDPSLEDRREAAEVHGCDERQCVRRGDLLLLRDHVLGHVVADHCGDLGLRSDARTRREPSRRVPIDRVGRLAASVSTTLEQLEDAFGVRERLESNRLAPGGELRLFRIRGRVAMLDRCGSTVEVPT